MNNKISIAILDDHYLIGEAIKSILIENPDFEVVKIYSNYNELFSDLKNQIIKIDMLFLDINLNLEINGIEVAKILNTNYPYLKINIITSHNQKSIILEILQNKINGFMIKNISKEELIFGLNQIKNNKIYIHPEIYNLLQTDSKDEDFNNSIKLTKREKEVLLEIISGLTTQEIAKKLFISKYTVESHRANIHSKTGTKNLASLVKYALDNNLLS